MPGWRARVREAADPLLATLPKRARWGGLSLLAVLAVGLALDALDPGFWAEHKARIAERDRQEQEEAAPVYDAGRIGDLLRSPARDWTDADAEYILRLAVTNQPVEKWNARIFELTRKWTEHDNGWVTSEEQQAIADRIARAMPREFAVHVIGVVGFDGGLIVTLRPEVQDVHWSVDCDLKRGMLDELVDQWRAALHAAQDAKGAERSVVDVTVRTERGCPLAMWDAPTGATIFPLPRCG